MDRSRWMDGLRWMEWDELYWKTSCIGSEVEAIVMDEIGSDRDGWNETSWIWKPSDDELRCRRFAKCHCYDVNHHDLPNIIATTLTIMTLSADLVRFYDCFDHDCFNDCLSLCHLSLQLLLPFISNFFFSFYHTVDTFRWAKSSAMDTIRSRNSSSILPWVWDGSLWIRFRPVECWGYRFDGGSVGGSSQVSAVTTRYAPLYSSI